MKQIIMQNRNNEYAKQVADNITDTANDIAHDLRLLEKTTEPQDKAAIRNRIGKSLKYVEQGAIEIGMSIARPTELMSRVS